MITGATSGIGYAFAAEFHNRGNRVIAVGRRCDRLDAMKREFPGMATEVCDIADAAQRVDLAARVISTYPELNVVINNAGIQLVTDLTKPVDLAAVMSEIETNLTAPIHLGSLLVPHLAGRAHAALINISSGLAFVPIAFMPVYCATKAALHSLTMSWRYQLRNTGVKVFEIAPPSTDTELGYQRRTDKKESHGGIPVAEFLAEAMEAIAGDELEAPIGQSKHLREKGAAMFPFMNK